jgi:hypothetical protein
VGLAPRPAAGGRAGWLVSAVNPILRSLRRLSGTPLRRTSYGPGPSNERLLRPFQFLFFQVFSLPSDFRFQRFSVLMFKKETVSCSVYFETSQFTNFFNFNFFSKYVQI